MKRLFFTLLLCSFCVQVLCDVTVSEGAASITTYKFNNFLYPSAPWEQCYPYTRTDKSEENFPVGASAKKNFKTVIIENERIKAVFLPSHGGRLYKLFDKLSGKDVLYDTSMTKPATLYSRGAGYITVLGGFKHGFPSYAHSPSDSIPWDYSVKKNPDGTASFVTWFKDLETDMNLTVENIVRPGASYVEFKISIENPTPYARKFYYWLCCQVEQTDDLEFTFPTDRMVLHGDMFGWPMRQVIGWPVYDGTDYGRYANWDDQQGLFQLKPDEDFMGSYDHGKDEGIVRIFPHETAKGTKLWCFQKNNPPVKMYSNNKNIYYELFGGLTESQDDYALMQPGGSVKWSEFWYPVNATGGFIKATKECALNVRKDSDANLKVNAFLSDRMLGDGIELEILINGLKFPLTPCAETGQPVIFARLAGSDLKSNDAIEVNVRDKKYRLINFKSAWGLIKHE